MLKRRIALGLIGTALIVTALIAGGVTLLPVGPPASAQTSIEKLAAQIVARHVDGERTEFGIQIGERVFLPSERFISRTSASLSWRRSSEIVIPDGRTVYVLARLRSSGSVEMGLRVDGVTERVLPQLRFVSAGLEPGNWVRSSLVTLPLPERLRTVAVASPELLALGGPHSCAIVADGSIECWGSHEYGQTDAPAGRFLSIGGGAAHNCALNVGGGIVCWGDNSLGQLDAPVGRYVALSVGFGHGCALDEDGEIDCWGLDFYGQATPAEGRFAAISAGDFYTCALDRNGDTQCWGDDLWGVTDVPAGVKFVAIDSGGAHSCGQDAEGALHCWGYGGDGQLNIPVGEYVSFTAGGWHTCAVDRDGELGCWGWDGHGQSSPPADQYALVTAGGGHTCGVTSSGGVRCWGSNGLGQTESPGGRYVSLAAGAGHTCALDEAGLAACWGSNGDGQSNPPAGSFVSIAPGTSHTCGVNQETRSSAGAGTDTSRPRLRTVSQEREWSDSCHSGWARRSATRRAWADSVGPAAGAPIPIP